jgi:O-antigen ligase
MGYWDALPMVAGILFIITSLAYLPHGIFNNAFDRNAGPQFVGLCISAIILGLLVFVKREAIKTTKIVLIGFLGLFAFSLISWLTSGNLITGLTGDTGRYNGLVSLYCLFIIALYFSQMAEAYFDRTLKIMLVGVLALDFLGFAQYLNWIQIPTGGGVGSTLGNLDFLSAWLGTTFLMFALVKVERSKKLSFLAIFGLFSIFLMIKIGAKQGLVDFIIIVVALAIYLVRARIPRLKLDRNVWTALGTFFVLLWCEVIYLVPIAKLPVPGVSGDVNVTIRSDFWYSGAAMFFHHLWLGVGPDNYGYYYEKYRSLSSVRKTESVISNDAHSAMVQTLSTLGIFAIIAIVILIVALIRSLIVLAETNPELKRRYAIFGLFFFIYLTNSLISPITLPNKFAFWALAGYVIGQAALISDGVELPKFSQAIPALMILVVAFTTVQFTTANLKFMIQQDQATFKKNVNYTYSAWLPCNINFNAQLALATDSGTDPMKVASQAVSTNPRCIGAQELLSIGYLQKADYKSAKPHVYQLLDLAPGRQEIVRIAAEYAVRSKDTTMQSILVRQGIRLGIVKAKQL